MSNWLTRLFLRRDASITAAEWMNRARLTIHVELPAVYQPAIRMISDRQHIILHVFCKSGKETMFRFRRDDNPERVVKNKVRPWIMEHEHPL